VPLEGFLEIIMSHKPFVKIKISDNSEITISVADYHDEHLKAVLQGPLNRMKKKYQKMYKYGSVHYTVPNDRFLIESVLRSFRAE
jgi:hypothetical protein